MSKDAWEYASHEGAERLQDKLARKLTLSERLDLLDDMLSFAHGLQEVAVVAEDDPQYGTGTE